MIGKLKGKVESIEDGALIIEVGGVGYCVRVPKNSAVGLVSPEVSLFIHTSVREDAIDLYGFTTQEELGFFKQLMTVQGVGPKSALGVLDSAELATLKRSIARGDAAALTKVFGIGKKSAERIVVELKDKISFDTPTMPGTLGSDMEVLEALIALGYSASESRTALKEVGDAVGTQARISAALKTMGRAA